MNKYKNRKKMKKIAIVGHFTGPNSFGISKPYMEFFSNFGEVQIITPWEKEIRNVDLLVLPGGPDVNPLRYLQPEDELSIYVGSPCPFKEKFDRELLPKYIENETPIFGICRGHQSLAVHFGAKLVQDMYHETNPDHDGTKTMHTVVVLEFIKDLIPTMSTYEQMEFDVNSRHHQTVANCPENASIIGVYNGKHKENGNDEIEALTYFPNYPAHTVQWHPEDKRDEFSIRLIYHLLSLKNN